MSTMFLYTKEIPIILYKHKCCMTSSIKVHCMYIMYNVCILYMHNIPSESIVGICSPDTMVNDHYKNE